MSSKPKKLRASFQGELGAFSHEAALRLLGPNVEVVPCQRFEDVFTTLRDGQVDAAVVPIENTLHGSVHENYDHLLHFDHSIVAETNVRIVHNLIALPGVTFRQLKRAFSHPVALNQCLRFLANNPQLKDAAAIASAVSAKIYGARILRRSVEDDRQNYTRFFLLRRAGDDPLPELDPAHKTWKSTLVFSIRNVPGSLFKTLSAFALRDISLTKIESRPLRGKPWEYLFYVDLLGHPNDERVRRALDQLENELADMVRVLGSYRV
jgi:prephenate dehydratase